MPSPKPPHPSNLPQPPPGAPAEDWPILNWKEVDALARAIDPEVRGLFVDRVIVPERPRLAEGYLKHEWVLRLSGRHAEAALYVSVRPRRPYLTYASGKGPKAQVSATHSPFSLSLSKQLKGAKVLGLEALPRERILVLWLTAEGKDPAHERLGLVLCLIPAVPEALLVRAVQGAPGWAILSRSRTLAAGKAVAEFAPPSGASAPADPPLRAALVSRADALYELVERRLQAEAFELRLRAAERELRELLKQTGERIRQSRAALEETRAEKDWQRLGELLKSSLHELGEPDSRGELHVTDYATGEQVAVPCDPKLSPREQVERYFQLARRRARRAEEARLRMETFAENQERWQKALAALPAAPDWAGLERLERLARIPEPGKGRAAGPVPAAQKKTGSWLGKSFVSKDGLTILAGRSKDENLELTFKHARGNDVWLHVRGRPGAHVLVPLTSGKSAPLETLLDAATLAIYYSGGEKWGKTEVDYTFKKHVRRIKDSTEASYTHNKTLLVEPDPARLKRLLGGTEGA
jgi:predicted ribosome quality control (RQC) complex YloA/Tae2 family protein